MRNAAIESGGAELASAASDRLISAVVDTDADQLLPVGMEVDVVQPNGAERNVVFEGTWHLIGYPVMDEAVEVAGGEHRRVRDIRDFLAFERGLVEAGREALLYPLSSTALDRIANVTPLAFGRLLALVEQAATSRTARLVAVLAHDIARVMSASDPGRAAALLTRYEQVSPVLDEILPTSRLPRTALLAWRCADVPAIVAARYRRLNVAMTDLAIAREVLAAEMAGKHEDVVFYVEQGLADVNPTAIARALTVAGFASEDPRLEVAFDGIRFRHGFLGEVASAAKQSYDEARWALIWWNAALEAVTDVDLWRFQQLALACADARCVLWKELGKGRRLFEAIRPVTNSLINDVIRARDRARGSTLFGIRAPSSMFTTNIMDATANAAVPTETLS